MYEIKIQLFSDSQARRKLKRTKTQNGAEEDAAILLAQLGGWADGDVNDRQ